MKVARQDPQSAIIRHRPEKMRASVSLRSIFSSVKKPLGLLAVCALGFNIPLAQAQDIVEDTAVVQPSPAVDTYEDDSLAPVVDGLLPDDLAELLDDPSATPVDPEGTPEAPEAEAPPVYMERAAKPRAVSPDVVIDASDHRLAVVKSWDGGVGYNGTAPARFKSAHIAFDFGFFDGSYIKAIDDADGTPYFGLEVGAAGSPYHINTDDRTVWAWDAGSCPQTTANGTCTLFHRHDKTKKVIFTFDGNRGAYSPGGFTVTTEGFEDAIVEPNEPVKVRLRMDSDKWINQEKKLTDAAVDTDFKFEEVARLPKAPSSKPGRIAQAYLVRGKSRTSPSELYHTSLDGSGLVKIGEDQHWVYNALAYDDITNQLVAISQKPAVGYELLYPAGHLLSIDPLTAKVTDRGEIEGFDPNDVSGGINTGTMTLDGDYWVANASLSGTGTLYAVSLGEGKPAVARTVSLYPGEGYTLPKGRPNANDYTYVLGSKGQYAFGMVNQLKNTGVTTPTLERITLDGDDKGRIDWYDLSGLSTPAGNSMPFGEGAIYGSAWTEPNGNLVFATNRTVDGFGTAVAYQLKITDPDADLTQPGAVTLVSASSIPTSSNNDATSYRPDHTPDLEIKKTPYSDALLISKDPESERLRKLYLWRIDVTNLEPKHDKPEDDQPSSGFILTDTLPVIKGSRPGEGYYSPFKNVQIVDGRALEALRAQLVEKYDGDELKVSEAIRAELKKKKDPHDPSLDPTLYPTMPDPAVDPTTGLLIEGKTPRHITCEVGSTLVQPDPDNSPDEELETPAFTCNSGPLEPQETKYVVVVAELKDRDDLIGPDGKPLISQPQCGPNLAQVEGLENDPKLPNNQSKAECPQNLGVSKIPAEDQDANREGKQTVATVYKEDGTAKAKVYYDILLTNKQEDDQKYGVSPIDKIVDSPVLPAGVKVESISAYRYEVKDGKEDPKRKQVLKVVVEPEEEWDNRDSPKYSISPEQIGVIPANTTRVIHVEVVVSLSEAALSPSNSKKLECASASPENLDNPSGALNAVRMAGEHDDPLGVKNNQACVSIVNPTAAISKSPEGGPAVELNGDGEGTLTYTITVTNTSPSGGQSVTVPSVIENVEIPASVEANGNITVEAPDTTGVEIGEVAPWFPAAQWTSGNKLTVAKNVKLSPAASQKIILTVPIKLKETATAEEIRSLAQCTRGADKKFNGGVPNSVSMETVDADGEDNNSACIPVIPAQPMPIYLEKVAYDAKTGITSQSLSGAEFRIEPAKANGASIVPIADASGRFSATLKPGSYYLVETKAPEGGYQLLPDKVPFKLVKDAKGARLEFADGYSSPLISFVNATEALPSNGATLGIQIADVRTGELPLTGPSHPLRWLVLAALFAVGILAFNLTDIRRVRRTT